MEVKIVDPVVHPTSDRTEGTMDIPTTDTTVVGERVVNLEEETTDSAMDMMDVLVTTGREEVADIGEDKGEIISTILGDFVAAITEPKSGAI